MACGHMSDTFMKVTIFSETKTKPSNGKDGIVSQF